jgi:hypothetical protein
MTGRRSCQYQRNQNPECGASRSLRPLPTQPTARISETQTITRERLTQLHTSFDPAPHAVDVRWHCEVVQGLRFRYWV